MLRMWGQLAHDPFGRDGDTTGRSFSRCNPLREKFEEWREWLLGDDIYSIRNQIHSMIWDSAIFQSINEARRYARKDKNGKPELNAAVHQFINKCFFETQAIAIRRLLDRNVACGRRSVVSLFRLLDDMERHVRVLTRENVLDALHLPYDYLAEKQELDRNWDGRFMVCGKDYWDCEKSDHVHKNMDLLTPTESPHRDPKDTISQDLLRWLAARVKKCEAVRVFVDKFLAHSATPDSRATITDEQTDITLGQILNAHKIICQIAEFVAQNLFLCSIGNPLPIAQFNQFEYFEKPWVTEDTLKRFHEWWHSYEDSTNQWLKWDWQSEYAAYRGGSDT